MKKTDKRETRKKKVKNYQEKIKKLSEGYKKIYKEMGKNKRGK